MRTKRGNPAEIDWLEFMGQQGSPPLAHGFSWWDPKPWKPSPPAEAELIRNHWPRGGELPQGDQKWRLNNPKKRKAVYLRTER